VAFDQKYITSEELTAGIELAKYVSSLISNFIESLKVSKFKGLKFKKPVSKNREEFEKLLREYLPKGHPLNP